MGPAERIIWSFLRIFANTLTMIGIIGLIGMMAIALSRFIDMITYEKENEK